MGLGDMVEVLAALVVTVGDSVSGEVISSLTLLYQPIQSLYVACADYSSLSYNWTQIYSSLPKRSSKDGQRYESIEKETAFGEESTVFYTPLLLLKLLRRGYSSAFGHAAPVESSPMQSLTLCKLSRMSSRKSSLALERYTDESP